MLTKEFGATPCVASICVAALTTAIIAGGPWLVETPPVTPSVTPGWLVWPAVS